MSTGHLLLACLLPFECAALFYGQRRLFFAAEDALRSHLLALLLAAPGTALHELAHLVMCWILRVPAGRQVLAPGGKRARVEFFRPRRDADGNGITLGRVPHAQADPLRGALIAVAPVLLVPPLLYGITYVMFGVHGLGALPHALAHAAWWKIPAWSYLALSCGQAAFPSPGDHVGAFGGLCLLVFAGSLLYAGVSSGGVARPVGWLSDIAELMLIPAAAAALCLSAFRILAMRGRKPVRTSPHRLRSPK